MTELSGHFVCGVANRNEESQSDTEKTQYSPSSEWLPDYHLAMFKTIEEYLEPAFHLPCGL